MHGILPRFILLNVFIFSFQACKHSNYSKIASDTIEAQLPYHIDKTHPKLCTAVRGNGPLIWAHFGSMANILENVGLVEGQAGGSSGSISTFIYESILENPAIWKNCEGSGQACSSQQVADRAAFLIKTLPYWLNVAKNSPESLALGYVIELKKTLAGFDMRKLDSKDLVTLQNALRGLRTLLSSSTLKSFLNPEFIDFISPLEESGLSTFRFRATEAKNELLNFGQFDAKSANILFRPGVIDFRAVAKAFGRIADFYAGRDPTTLKQWPDLLDSCTEFARGKNAWEMENSDCGKKMNATIADYMSRPATQVNNHRIEDSIGSAIPSIASTTVLIGQTDRMAEARNRYIQSQNPNLELPQGSVFFGYSGSARSVALLKSQMPSFPDKRSQLFLSLGTMSWGDMLSISPAEPGLTNALPFEDGDTNKRTSFGGWADLSPVMVLKAINCEKVIYVTREGTESEFAQGVASLVGLKDQIPEIYDIENPKSSFAEALNLADSVYCTKWNDFHGTSFEDIRNMFQQAYRDSTLYTGSRTGAPLGCARVK